MAVASNGAGGQPGQGRWDVAYEFKTVLLLTLAFGLVGLDRWILPPLFAAGMGKDLGLGPADLGELVGILGIAWGVSAILMGGLSDRIGRRNVLVPAVVLFSILSGLSGFAMGMASLLVIRAIMGVSEGAVAPTGVAAAVEASHPSRRGMNNGLFQCAFALFGLALAPILATQLIQVTSWRNVFLIVGIPGLIVAILLWFVIREPLTITGEGKGAPKRVPWLEMFKHRNIPLGMIGLLCAMAGIFVISAMMPSYLTGYLHLTAQDMGFVTAAIGLGGFLGQFSVPALSDLFGRKLVSVVAFVISAAFLFWFIQTGVNLPLLFALLFVASWANFGALALIAGPLAAEAAPLGLISSASGLIIGCGEIFGGGVAPAIAGGIAQDYGLQYVLYFAMGGQLLGIIVSLFFQETAPKLTHKGEGEVSDLDRFEDSHGGRITAPES